VRDEEAARRLSEINRLRGWVSGPLIRLSERLGEADSASGKAGALAAFFDDLGLAGRLSARADMLEADGRKQAAAETARLWDIVVSALEQFHEILGDAEMDTDAFSRLFLLALSQYDVGVIPVSLDMVTAGDMDRMRRRHIKHLIVLGASDETPCPGARAGAGSFPGTSAWRFASSAFPSTRATRRSGGSFHSFTIAFRFRPIRWRWSCPPVRRTGRRRGPLSS
jgi:ATP-dependent helicase/DNAse subunit B